MQGVIYKSIEDLVVAGWGAETWAEILKRAGVDDPAFVGMSRYPDELPGKIVGAASAVLKLAPEDVMRAFGRHWTTNTAPTYYGELMPSPEARSSRWSRTSTRCMRGSR